MTEQEIKKGIKEVCEISTEIATLYADNNALVAKLKEVFPQPTSRHKNTTFNFAQPHQKPTHHPTTFCDPNYIDRVFILSPILTKFAV